MKTYIVEYAMHTHQTGKEMFVEAENKADAWLEAVSSHHSGSTPAWAIVRGVILKDGTQRMFSNTSYKHPF